MLNNIKSYGEEINEAAAALPKMPAFLKNAGAVVVAASNTSHAHPISEHWGLNINNITKYFPYDKKFEVDFYPISSTEGNWFVDIFPNGRGIGKLKLTSKGKYKTSGSANANLFGTDLFGVELTSTHILDPGQLLPY